MLSLNIYIYIYIYREREREREREILVKGKHNFEARLSMVDLWSLRSNKHSSLEGKRKRKKKKKNVYNIFSPGRKSGDHAVQAWRGPRSWRPCKEPLRRDNVMERGCLSDSKSEEEHLYLFSIAVETSSRAKTQIFFMRDAKKTGKKNWKKNPGMSFSCPRCRGRCLHHRWCNCGLTRSVSVSWVFFMYGDQRIYVEKGGSPRMNSHVTFIASIYWYLSILSGQHSKAIT